MSKLSRVGVRGLPEGEISQAIDVFEIDALDPTWESIESRRRLRKRLAPNQGVLLKFGHYFLRGEDRTDQRERIRAATESIEQFEAEASIIAVPPSFENSLSLSESLGFFKDEFIRKGLALPRVDAPFSHPFPLERVGDPLWEKTPEECTTRIWIIHGFHSERWIRLYSGQDLDHLAEAALKYKPETIVFAHSQRFVQVEDFLQRMKSKDVQR